MAKTFPIDEVLGPVAWNAECRWWTFEAGTPGSRSIRGSIIPEVEGALPSEEWLQLIRACVVWLRANESRLRRRVAEAMFDYWLQTYYDEDEDTVDSPVAFAAVVSTAAVQFCEGLKAEVWYDDAGLFGNQGLWVRVDADGQFVEGPHFA